MAARENGHQGLASGRGDALEVEVALASGTGAGGGRGSSPKLKRRWQELTGETEKLEVDDEDPVVNVQKFRELTVKLE
jgi:hypothetical protein